MTSAETLAELLLARIAEVEDAARRAATLPDRVRVEWQSPSSEDDGVWGYNGGPFRVSGVDPRIVEVLKLVDSDAPGRVNVISACDLADPETQYDVAVVPGDHDAAEHIARNDPAHVLAECEAKRRIVDLHSGAHHCDGGPDGTGWVHEFETCPTLQALALPYARRAE